MHSLPAHPLRRLLLLAAGLFIMAFGVAFSIKAGLGTSPISSLPYVLSLFTPLTVGTATIALHVTLILLQILLLRRRYDPVQLAQLPVALLFGGLTDFSVWALQGINVSAYPARWGLCLVGILLVEHSGTRAGTRTTPLGFVRDLFSKPPIVAVLFTVLLLLLDLELPGPIMTCGSYISNSVSPLALIYCGFIVYELGLKNLRIMQGMPVMLVMRLAVAPAICWTFCHLFGVTGLARDVFLVESALPVVSQVTVLAGNYGADDKYAATGAVLSTLCSFLSIPVLMVILG